jgi:hypothetical protein
MNSSLSECAAHKIYILVDQAVHYSNVVVCTVLEHVEHASIGIGVDCINCIVICSLFVANIKYLTAHC